VLVAPAGAPFVGVVLGPDGGAFVARADGVVVHVNSDGVVDDVACATCARRGQAPSAGGRRPSMLRLDQGFSLVRRGETPFLTQNAWDLFVFPYGTTGEPYLEFAPDSPAFWGVVRGAKNTTFTLVDEPGPTRGLVQRREATMIPVAVGVDVAGAWRSSGDRLWHHAPGSEMPIVDDDDDDDDRDDDRCAESPALATTLSEVVATDRVSARLKEAMAPGLLWRLLPVVDIAGGQARVDTVADLFAVFRDGVERSAPAGFVRRTLQGQVDNNEGAALARSRVTTMPYAMVQLRFDLDRLVGEPADVRIFERRWRRRAEQRLANAAALVDEHRRLCARPATTATELRRAAIVDELAIVSPRWRGVPLALGTPDLRPLGPP